MKSGLLALLFHVASNKENMCHCPHRPTGSGNWCKYNIGRANNSQNYQRGPGLPKNIIYRIRPIFLE